MKMGKYMGMGSLRAGVGTWEWGCGSGEMGG